MLPITAHCDRLRLMSERLCLLSPLRVTRAARPVPAVRMDAGSRSCIGVVGRGLPDRRLFGRDLERGQSDFAAFAVRHRQCAAVRRLRDDLERRARLPWPAGAVGPDVSRRRGVSRLPASLPAFVPSGAARVTLSSLIIARPTRSSRRHGIVARAAQDADAALARDLRADAARRGVFVSSAACRLVAPMMAVCSRSRAAGGSPW